MKFSINRFIFLLIFIINILEAAVLENYDDDDLASYEYNKYEDMGSELFLSTQAWGWRLGGEDDCFCKNGASSLVVEC